MAVREYQSAGNAIQLMPGRRGTLANENDREGTHTP
jgi:hypothetical protein